MTVKIQLLQAACAASIAVSCFAQAPTIASFNPPLSAVGLPVYIAGTNFTGATSVTFKGHKAPFIVDSPELIVALVPLAAGTGNVVVTTPGGSASSAFDIVTTYWDAVQNFSLNSNPNGAWSYGEEPDGGGAFTLFTTNTNCFTEVPCWWNGINYPASDAVALNTSAYEQHVETIIAPNDELWMGPENNMVVVRWTAPVTAEYWIFGEFQGIDLNLPVVTVTIVENGTDSLFSGTISTFGYFETFNLSNLHLKAGTTIDFTASAGTVNSDNIGLAATIDQIQ